VRPTAGGNLTIGSGVTVRTATNSSFATLGDASLSLTNLGTIKSQSSSGWTFLVKGSTFTNSGTLQAIGGGVLQAATTPTNFSSGTLTGGTWHAASGGILRVSLPGTITTNAASIILDGATSNFYRDAGSTKALVVWQRIPAV
jgi:hypothetical protein